MRRLCLLAICTLLSSCATSEAESWPFVATPIAKFDRPWAMTFLPDGRLLVTQKAGQLLLVAQPEGETRQVSGVPAVDFGGQGGLGDVVLHPQFSSNQLVYLSYVEAGKNNRRGAAVAQGRLHIDADSAALKDVKVIWRQLPKVTGRGHYGHRIAFSADGYLFVSSGDRQKFDPAQDMQQTIGKIVRLHDDGSVPDDNPFYELGGISAQIWSIGHRNPLGLAFDSQGRLWNQEMGPRHGDELNLVKKGKNYGYPIVSNGDHYDGRKFPNHDTRPEFEAPKAYWVPAISPGGLLFYDADMFPQWRGNAFIGGLGSQALIRVEIDGDTAREVERFAMGARIREQEQGPDGAIWLLEDGGDSPGRLLKLTPKEP